MSNLAPVLNGAVAMASFVAMLFFLRFWRQTQDSFFLFFAFAFGLDAAIRLVLGLGHFSEETEPLIYLARAVSFASIILAVIRKNTSGRLS
jgi:uncharacterized membrane protein HdeD (DUF308 family)